MKIFALTFSFYLLFLAIYPAFGASIGKMNAAPSSKSYCHDTHGGKHSNGNESCPKGTRTPLFGCPYIQLIIHQIDEIHFSSITITIENSFYKESPYVVFLLLPWHPPKFG